MAAPDYQGKVRSLIIWGLSHDYKRVLRSLRQVANELLKDPRIDHFPELKKLHTTYTRLCNDLEELLDRAGNLLNEHKNDEIVVLLQPLTKSIDDLIGRLVRTSEKVAGVIYPGADVDTRTREAANTLVDHTRRARDQMLALWSMPFNKIVAQKPTRFRIRRELGRVLSDLRSVFLANEASIRENVEIISTEMLTVDRTMFSVAVSNIIANAVVHSHRGKKLRLKIEETVEKTDQNGYVTLSISDNGPGIPKEEQKSIFLLFKQGKLGTEYERGSGVGLTFAQFAMDLVGGSVALVPVNEGALFQLRFPIIDGL